MTRPKTRKDGQCSWCSRVVTTGKRCDICRARQRNHLREFKKKNVSNGMCSCGKERAVDRKRCQSCIDKRLAYVKQNQRLNKCGNCGKHADGGKYCDRCHSSSHLRKRSQYFLSNSLCIRCGNKPSNRNKWCDGCLQSAKNKRDLIRDHVFNAYGGYRCICCNIDIKEFLVIDHVHNDGADHRKNFTGSLYYWLYRNGLPDGFQILCANCNHAKGVYGHCPHTNLPKE